MELVEQVRSWTYDRQRLLEPAKSPLQALKDVVAVYATHPTCPLALAARTKGLTAASYRKIDRDRRGVRIPAMRASLFLVPATTAAQVFTAARAPGAQANAYLTGAFLKRHKFDPKRYAAMRTKVLAATKEPIAARKIGVAGVNGQVLGIVLRGLRYEGALVAIASDSMMSGTHRYVAASEWFPDGLDAGDPSAALEWLAGRYLSAYGPARIEDFAWWMGVSKKSAREALSPHRTIDVGNGLLLPARYEAAFNRVKKVTNRVDLLPKWDAYTMGHAPDGRARFVHPENQKEVYSPIGIGFPGDGNPVILVDGQVAGLWKFTRRDGATVKPFEKFGPKVRKRVDERLEELRALLAE